MSELSIELANEQSRESDERKQLRMMRRTYRAHAVFNAATAEIRKGQVCITCKKRLPLGMFSASIVRGRKYLHHRCISCRATVALRSKACKAKRALLDRLRSVPCSDCGNTFAPHAMIFDHIRGVRLFSVSMAWTGRREVSIIAEAKKCDVVCAICMTARRKRRRDRHQRRRFMLAELPPDLASQVDLAARLEQLHGPEAVTGRDQTTHNEHYVN